MGNELKPTKPMDFKKKLEEENVSLKAGKLKKNLK